MDVWRQLPLPMHRSPKATPAPVFRTPDKVAAQRIPFDVTRDGQKVGVALHHERFEAPLVKMAGSRTGAIGMTPLGVSERNKAHVPGEIAILTWPEQKVPVVGHYTPGKDAHWYALLHLYQHALEREVVAVLLEDPAFTVRAI
jgi:hypothetical protein